MKIRSMLSAIAAAYIAFAPLSAALAQPAPVTQNTVTTTGPVSSDTTISVGTLAGEVLKWVSSVAVTVLGTFGAVLITKVLKRVGMDVSAGLSQQLNETLINGLNNAAANAATQLAGRDPITIKNAIVQNAVRYAQDHRAETIKALGLDPQSGSAVEALKARIATLIADPNSPTPPVLGGPNAPPAPPKAA